MLRPKPRREWRPLDSIIFPAELQLRHFPDGKLFDEATVVKYVEAMEAGEEFPPIEAVEETPAKGKIAKLWCLAGYHRGEAYRRRGVNSVEVLIFPGSWKDAEFWALSENSRHGKHRTPEECRAVFDKLVSSPSMLTRACDMAKGRGGVERGIAMACGLSHGAVGKYLADAGLRADRVTGRLIPADATISPEHAARAELSDELMQQGQTRKQAAEALGISEEALAASRKKAARAGDISNAGSGQKLSSETDSPVRPRGRESTPVQVNATGEDAVRAGIRESLGEAQRLLRKYGLIVEDLLRSPAGDALRVAAKARGLAFEVREVERNPIDRKVPVLDKVESWPVLGELSAVLADVAAGLFALKAAG